MMSICLLSNCWNERRMLPFFFRHYDPIVDHYVILDDGSTDGSVELLLSHPKVKLIQANRKGGSYIEQTRIFFNEAWKENRCNADWIIACNIDEHLYHRDLVGYLHQCKDEGVTILPANGFEMVAERFPSTHATLCEAIKFGAPAHKFKGATGQLNKIMVFDPSAIDEICFAAGRHTIQPRGRVVYPESIDLKMLHYKFLGLTYAEQRYAELKTGLAVADIKTGKGYQYFWDRKEIRQHYARVICSASIVITGGFIKDMQLNISFLPLRLIFVPEALFESLCRMTRTALSRMLKRARARLRS